MPQGLVFETVDVLFLNLVGEEDIFSLGNIQGFSTRIDINIGNHSCAGQSGVMIITLALSVLTFRMQRLIKLTGQNI